MRPISAASVAGATGAASMSPPSAFSRLLISPITQLATSLGWPQAVAHGLVVAGGGQAGGHHRAS
jgi:hypothetical protein